MLERSIPVLPFFAAFFFFSFSCLLGTWWVSPFWSLACSFVFCGSFALFQYLCFSLLVSLFLFSGRRSCILCGARSVRAAVFSLTCLSYPRSVVFRRYSLSLGAVAALFVSLLTPRLLIGRVLNSGDLFALALFILRFC